MRRGKKDHVTHRWFQLLLCSKRGENGQGFTHLQFSLSRESSMWPLLISAFVQNGWSFLIFLVWNSNEGAVLLCSKPFIATGLLIFTTLYLVFATKNNRRGFWTDRGLLRLWEWPLSEWIQRGSWWSAVDALNRLPSSPGARTPSAGCWEIELAHVLAITSQHGIGAQH